MTWIMIEGWINFQRTTLYYEAQIKQLRLCLYNFLTFKKMVQYRKMKWSKSSTASSLLFKIQVNFFFGWKADSHISEYFQAEMKEMSTAERVESIFRQMDEVRQLLFQFCNNFSSLYEIQSYPLTFRIKVESWARRSSSTAPEKTPQLLQHFHFTVEPDVVRTQTKLIRVVSNKISFYVDTRMTFWHNTTKHA